jgi:branched-chain amino acid aminotransferase
MQETEFIWLNGKLVKWNEARIHVLTHALHYGSGAFEGIRCYKTEKGPAVFRLKEHLGRLFASFSIFKIEIPYSKEEIEKAILDTVKVNKLEEGYIRPIIFFGYGAMGLQNLHKAELNTAIVCWPWPAYLGGKAVRVKVSKYIRIHPKSLEADKKITGHYVNSILASLEAKESGYDEALLLDSEGNICEGPGENFFIIKDSIIKTPPLKGQILPGITRDSVIRIAQDFGYSINEQNITLKEALEADEAFFTGTAAEVTPIASIDDKEIGSGKVGEVTKKLQEAYLDAVHGRTPRYENWLSYAERIPNKTAIVVLAITFALGFYSAYLLYNKTCEWSCPPNIVYSQGIEVIQLNDRNYFPAVLSAIESASQSIDIAVFEFRFYENKENKARQLLDALISARARGINIRVLLDESDWNKETSNRNKETIGYLKDKGIQAKLDNPKKTLHAKLIIIDDSTIIGSHNLGFYALERNKEASVLIKNKDVANAYKSYFEFLWQND